MAKQFPLTVAGHGAETLIHPDKAPLRANLRRAEPETLEESAEVGFAFPKVLCRSLLCRDVNAVNKNSTNGANPIPPRPRFPGSPLHGAVRGLQTSVVAASCFPSQCAAVGSRQRCGVPGNNS